MHSDSLETVHLHVHANPEGLWTLQSNAGVAFVFPASLVCLARRRKGNIWEQVDFYSQPCDADDHGSVGSLHPPQPGGEGRFPVVGVWAAPFTSEAPQLLALYKQPNLPCPSQPVPFPEPSKVLAGIPNLLADAQGSSQEACLWLRVQRRQTQMLWVPEKQW